MGATQREACNVRGLLVDLSELGASSSQFQLYTPNTSQGTSYVYIPRPDKNVQGSGTAGTITTKNQLGYPAVTTYAADAAGRVDFVQPPPIIPIDTLWQAGDDIITAEGVFEVTQVIPGSTTTIGKTAAGFGPVNNPVSIGYKISNNGGTGLVTFFDDNITTRAQLGYNATYKWLIIPVATNNLTLGYFVDSAGTIIPTQTFLDVGDLVLYTTHDVGLQYRVQGFDPSGIAFFDYDAAQTSTGTAGTTSDFEVISPSGFTMPNPLPFNIGDQWAPTTTPATPAKAITAITGGNTLEFGSTWATPSTILDFGDWGWTVVTEGELVTTPPHPQVPHTADLFLRERFTTTPGIDMSPHFIILKPDLLVHTGFVSRTFNIRTFQDTSPMSPAIFGENNVRRITFYFTYNTNDETR